jgi:hypothetical protein
MPGYLRSSFPFYPREQNMCEIHVTAIIAQRHPGYLSTACRNQRSTWQSPKKKGRKSAEEIKHRKHSHLPSEWRTERQRLHVIVRRKPERDRAVEHDARGTENSTPFTGRTVDAEFEAGKPGGINDLSSLG